MTCWTVGYMTVNGVISSGVFNVLMTRLRKESKGFSRITTPKAACRRCSAIVSSISPWLLKKGIVRVGAYLSNRNVGCYRSRCK